MSLLLPKPKMLGRVLLIHPFGIGDALFITPVIRTLKENGVGQIDLLLGSRTRAVFETNPHVRNIFEWDKSKPMPLGHLLRLLFRIWKKRYQAVFDFTPTGQYGFLSFFFFGFPFALVSILKKEESF